MATLADADVLNQQPSNTRLLADNFSRGRQKSIPFDFKKERYKIMACKNVCRLCKNLIISESVTFTAGTGRTNPHGERTESTHKPFYLANGYSYALDFLRVYFNHYTPQKGNKSTHGAIIDFVFSVPK